jgi:hypothetical protein
MYRFHSNSLNSFWSKAEHTLNKVRWDPKVVLVFFPSDPDPVFITNPEDVSLAHFPHPHCTGMDVGVWSSIFNSGTNFFMM